MNSFGSSDVVSLPLGIIKKSAIKIGLYISFTGGHTEWPNSSFKRISLSIARRGSKALLKIFGNNKASPAEMLS